ncbi:TPA: hypothetical protein ACIBS5_000526 [Salmonella enterica subsp. diarizonae serovar 60-67:z35:-]
MKKRLTKKESIRIAIEKRNSDLDINRRLHRVFELSIILSGKLHLDGELQDEFKSITSILFSYFSDDVGYVINELNKRKNNSFGEVESWDENNKRIADIVNNR